MLARRLMSATYIPPPPPPPVYPVATWRGEQHNFNSATSYSFDDVPFGGADASRQIIVIVWGLSTSTRTFVSGGITIGGVTATFRTNNTSRNNPMIIASAASPLSVAAGNVTVEFSGVVEACVVMVYSMTGAQSSSPSSAVVDMPSIAANPNSTPVNVPARAIVISAAFCTANVTPTWSPGTMVERYNDFLGYRATTAQRAGSATTIDPLNVEVAWGASPGLGPRMATIVWR